MTLVLFALKNKELPGHGQLFVNLTVLTRIWIN